jgi:hypothetical protein
MNCQLLQLPEAGQARGPLNAVGTEYGRQCPPNRRDAAPADATGAILVGQLLCRYGGTPAQLPGGRCIEGGLTENEPVHLSGRIVRVGRCSDGGLPRDH